MRGTPCSSLWVIDGEVGDSRTDGRAQELQIVHILLIVLNEMFKVLNHFHDFYKSSQDGYQPKNIPGMLCLLRAMRYNV